VQRRFEAGGKVTPGILAIAGPGLVYLFPDLGENLASTFSWAWWILSASTARCR